VHVRSLRGGRDSSPHVHARLSCGIVPSMLIPPMASRAVHIPCTRGCLCGLALTGSPCTVPVGKDYRMCVRGCLCSGGKNVSKQTYRQRTDNRLHTRGPLHAHTRGYLCAYPWCDCSLLHVFRRCTRGCLCVDRRGGHGALHYIDPASDSCSKCFMCRAARGSTATYIAQGPQVYRAGTTGGYTAQDRVGDHSRNR